MNREEIVLVLCGMIDIGTGYRVFREPRVAGVDWNPDALNEHPMFDHFVALVSHDVTHTAETLRAAWSWFQAGFHADHADEPLDADGHTAECDCLECFRAWRRRRS